MAGKESGNMENNSSDDAVPGRTEQILCQPCSKFFCEDENKLCCSTCAIVDHRKCHSVVEIQKIDRRSAVVKSKLKVTLQEVQEKAENIVKHAKSSKEQLDQDVKEVSITIRRMRDNVMKMFDDLEVSVAKDAESFKTETLDKLTRKQSNSEKYVADATKSLETIDNQTGDDVGEPLYTGLDFLPDGRLVAVDNKNMKCLIYNEKLEI
ncbi:uncharacterized protein LOC128554898, partial [Mercenaria mercenaria]|uniref:uncharacterized protein LOC128554898 n=1 Tax=Mercenaria mercenaria TaxID=6596 RepID=UPI00234F5F79